MAKQSKNPKKGNKPEGDKALEKKASKTFNERRQNRKSWMAEAYKALDEAKELGEIEFEEYLNDDPFTLFEERMAESMAGSLR